MNVMVHALAMRPWGALAWAAYYDSLYPTAKPADQAAYLETLRANLHQRGRLEALQAMLSASKADVEIRLNEVRARTLVVMGTQDPDFTAFAGGPAGEAALVADRLGGKVLMVDGAGHYPHVEMAEQVTPSILSFLNAQSGA
jgi:pimeloyl-ACP methyl ester carboxylesterase